MTTARSLRRLIAFAWVLATAASCSDSTPTQPQILIPSPQPLPRAGTWFSDIVRFNVSPDGRLSRTDSQIEVRATLALGPILFSTPSCGGRQAFLYSHQDLSLAARTFEIRESFAAVAGGDAATWRVTGSFPSTSMATGTYDFEYFSSLCQHTVRGVGTWTATPTT